MEEARSQFLRPLVVRNVIESVTGDQNLWLGFPGLLAAVELFNISTYQGDAALEGERTIREADSSGCFFPSVGLPLSLSFITLSWASELIRDARLALTTRKRLLTALAATAGRVYRGQLQDGVDLRRTKSLDPLKIPEEEFRRKYLARCLNLDGYQFAFYFYLGLSVAFDEQLMPNSPLAKALLRVGLEFGTCLQILNDLDDFLTDRPELAFRDLETGRITYFAYILWHRSPSGRLLVETLLKNIQTGRNPGVIAQAQALTKKEAPLLQEAARILLNDRYQRLKAALACARPLLADDGRLLDFIFPHIFLSRILRACRKRQRQELCEQLDRPGIPMTNDVDGA
jgi:hypothetical protein